jgi:hypothetical protein
MKDAGQPSRAAARERMRAVPRSGRQQPRTLDGVQEQVMISYAGPQTRLPGTPTGRFLARSRHHALARPRALRDPTESIRFDATVTGSSLARAA